MCPDLSSIVRLTCLIALCAGSVGCTMGPGFASLTRVVTPLTSTPAAQGGVTPLPVPAEALKPYHESVKAIVEWYDALPPDRRAAECERAGLIVVKDPTAETGLVHFEPADRYHSGLLDQYHTRPGVGVPVVAWRPNDGTGRLDNLRPPEGLAAAYTAVVLPAGEGKWTLRFVNPVDHSTLEIGGKPVTVAANYSAPIAQLVEKARPLARSGFSGMLSPTKSKRREKLYLMEPYDPKKIPLLMVHGLQSTPVAFINLTNDLQSDPMVRQRYQIWHYHYQTGTPVLLNATNFRRVLSSTLKEIDPQGDDFATNHLVVIGHSMGGILTHTLVSEPGYKLWDSVIKVRPDKVKMPPESLAQLKDVFLFHHDPRVKRVVFISVPHRGSTYADNFVGDLGQTLFRPDRKVTDVFGHLVEVQREVVHPFVVGLYEQGKFSSIRTLSASSPSLQMLATLPPEVPFHSIIGQKGGGPLDLGSDGIVTYKSSHLDGAESELVVRSGHNSFRKQEAVAEIKRILYEHLRKSGS
jgi:pimeloyl-ACP methyl ester carboxylesterase